MRRLKAAFVALTIGAVLIGHAGFLPPPAQAFGVALMRATGQDLRWSMFAPDPRDFWVSARLGFVFEDQTSHVIVIDPDRVERYRQHKWLEAEMFRGDRAFAELQDRLDFDREATAVNVWIEIHRVPSPGSPIPEPIRRLAYQYERP